MRIFDKVFSGGCEINVSAIELGIGKPDSAWLDFAREKSRLIVTSEKDFGDLIFRGVSVFTRNYPVAIRKLTVAGMVRQNSKCLGRDRVKSLRQLDRGQKQKSSNSTVYLTELAVRSEYCDCKMLSKS